MIEQDFDLNFAFKHLPPHLQQVSAPFHRLALQVYNRTTKNPGQRDVALQKLLEAKDAAVRAAVAQ